MGSGTHVEVKSGFAKAVGKEWMAEAEDTRLTWARSLFKQRIA